MASFAALRDAAQDRQRREVIATDRQRNDARLRDAPVEGDDAVQGVHEIGGIDGSIAEIGDIGHLRRDQPRHLVHPADHGREVADLSRSVPCAGPVGGAAVPGYADKADLDVLGLGSIEGKIRQAHEGCGRGKPRDGHAGDRLEMSLFRRFGHGTIDSKG